MESRQTRRQRYLNYCGISVGAIAVGISLAVKAATVTFAWTNYDGTVATNDLIVGMVSPQPYSDGSYVTIGLPKRFPTTNGAAARYLLPANYSVIPYDPRGLLNIVEPVIFAVPNSTNTFNFWRLRISGGNTYNYTPGVRTLTAGANTAVVDDGEGNLTVSAATNVTTSFATNAGNVTAAALTNQVYSSNVVGAFQEVRHATNADQSVHATNTDYVTFPTLTNRIFGSNIIGALTEAAHATNADFVAGTITNKTYGSNTIGAIAESTHSTNADNVTAVTLTNKVFGSNITGAATQATHATNSDNVTAVTLTNLVYGTNLVGAAAQAGHTTNADFVLLSTLTNKLFSSNLVGAASESTHTTNSDNVTAQTLTNKVFGSNVIGSLTSTVVTASFVTQPTLTNQVTNIVGAVAQATHATNADNVTLPTLTNKLYSSNLVGATSEAAHATNSDNVTLPTLTNKVYSSNFIGAAAQATHATNADIITTAIITNQVYGTNVIGGSSASNALTATYVTIPTVTNKAYASNLIGAASESMHATNADNVTLATLTNKVYSSNFVGAAAQATHATNADISTVVTVGTLTNQVYGSNVVGLTVAPIGFVTNAILTNKVYSSNAIGAASEAVHSTNADYVTRTTITNRIYGSNIIGFPAGPVEIASTAPIAQAITFGGVPLLWYNDDDGHFYLQPGITFLFDGREVTNVQAANIAGTVSNSLRSTFASFATNSANPTNAVLTNHIYGSNIDGAIPTGLNVLKAQEATHATNADMASLATNVNGSIQLGTNLDYRSLVSIATNFICSSNAFYVRTITTILSNGVSVDLSLINQTYHPVNSHDWTNANNAIHFYAVPDTDPDLGSTFVFARNTNSPAINNWLAAYVNSPDDACVGGSHAVNDLDGTTYNDTAFFASNEVYTSFSAPLVTTTNLNSASNSLLALALSKTVLRSNLVMDLKWDFGASGDGSHDDTTNLQNAVNYLWGAAANIRLYIPKGIYRIVGDINFPAESIDGLFGGQEILGDGASEGGTALRFVTSGCKGFNMQTNASANITFRKLLFEGPQRSGFSASESGTAVKIGPSTVSRGSSFITIEECNFNGFATCISLTNCWDTKISRCIFMFSSRTCIAQSGTHVSHIQDCWFYGIDGSPINDYRGDKAIWFQTDNGNGAGDDAYIENCDISGFTNAIMNDGDVSVLINSSHMEFNGSFYTATNTGGITPLTSIKNIYLLDSVGHDTSTPYKGIFNLHPDALANLVVENLLNAIGSGRPTVDVPTDPNSLGFVPPLVVGNNLPVSVRWLGVVTNYVLPIQSRATGQKNDSLIILSNSPANWPATPMAPGAADIVSSNGVIFMRQSTNGAGGVTNIWTITNKWH